MPQVRQRVLSLALNQSAPSADPKPDGAVAAKDDTTPFMKELQRMYSHLLASQEKYFDPSKLFKSLVDEQGNPVRIGSQEDVGEFNDLFLWRMSKGLAPPPSSEAEMQVDDSFCSTMFDAEAVEVLVAKDENGEVKEVEKPVDIGRHLVRVFIDSVSFLLRLEISCFPAFVDSPCGKGNQRSSSIHGPVHV